MTANDRAKALVVQLAERGGYAVPEESVALLDKQLLYGELTWNTHFTNERGIGDIMIAGPEASSLSTHELGQLGVIASAAHRGFYDAAAKGIEFVPSTEVESRFGRSVDDNYRGTVAGPAFLRFARSYWSFRVIESAVHDEECRTVCCAILSWIDSRVAPLFFPMPTAIPAKRRKRDQKSFLEMFAPRDMDIDDFLSRNPILAASPGGSNGRTLWYLGACVVFLILLISRC